MMLCEDVVLKGWGAERAGGVMMHNWGARVFISMQIKKNKKRTIFCIQEIIT